LTLVGLQKNPICWLTFRNASFSYQENCIC
jgi:hypothetical protein